MYVYLIKEEVSETYKIGVSRSPKKRISELQTANANKLVLEKEVEVVNGYLVERLLHKNFSSKRKEGEWFSLDEEDLKAFEEKALLYDINYETLKKVNTYLNK